MLMRLIVLFLILLVLWVYLRNFEHNNIYFPSSLIEFTPGDVGLKYEDIFYQSKDGKRINGWFIPAEEARGTILFCHGNGGNIGHRIDFFRLFNQLGLSVFIFDYRGYGKSPGRTSEKGVYLDAQGAYDYLISRSDVDKDKIIIYGESLGGAVAINLADKIKASSLVTFGVFTSTIDMGKELYPHLPVKLFLTQKYDSISKIKDIDIPKLIVHSSDDEIVPFAHGKELYGAASYPKEFLELRGGHNEAILLGKEKFSKKLIDFLTEYDIK